MVAISLRFFLIFPNLATSLQVPSEHKVVIGSDELVEIRYTSP